MKRMKLFPKIFLYTLTIMLFVVVISHGLIYLLAPRMQLSLSTQDDVVVSINQAKFITEAVTKALPISLSYSLLISIVCSLLFSKAIADPIKRISASTERMMELDQTAIQFHPLNGWSNLLSGLVPSFALLIKKYF